MSNKSQVVNHWALCTKQGEVFYDEYGRAFIFESRELARGMSATMAQYDLHVEKVEIK